jgi:hypothetical protein
MGNLNQRLTFVEFFAFLSLFKGGGWRGRAPCVKNAHSRRLPEDPFPAGSIG